MEKETIEEQKWVTIDLGGLSQALVEQAWMESTQQSDTSDLYHHEFAELPYPIPISTVKKTVKEYWRSVYDRLYNRYKSLVLEFKRPIEDGDHEKRR